MKMPKRLIAQVASVALIVACAAGLVWALTAPSAGLHRSSFRVGEMRTVHFAGVPEDEAGADPDDQLRDWLLCAALEERGLGSDKISRVLYDLPPQRTGFTAPLAAYEFGPTRFRTLDGDTVLALVPGGTREQRKDHLGQVADAARSALGSRPRTVEVYEYSLDATQLTGTLKRLSDVPGEKLFTTDYGYREQRIASLTELEAFLAGADDVVSVEVRDGALWIAGRETGMAFGRMRVEDVAALWQSAESLAEDKKKISDFDDKWKSESYLESVLDEDYNRQVQALSSAGAAPSRSAKERLKQKFQDRQYQMDVLQQRHRADEAELRKGLASKGSEGIPEGSGFSLDPAFDYKQLTGLFDEYGRYLTGGTPEELADIRASLEKHDEGPLLEAMYKFKHQQNQLTSDLLELLGFGSGTEIISQAKFQHARYDGKLAGTEVGMVLFYTDLLAKLWALDYFDRAPEKQVAGFVPLLKISTSPIYEKEEEELANTRLWFGPRESGYSKTAHGLAFSRISTRVYAASSDPLRPGREAEANASSSLFLGWWNDHYAQVAEFEPQYKRLNEIMKWSVLIGWLPQAGGLDQMNWLGGVTVERDNWFPDWAKQNRLLRFTDWTRESNCDKGKPQRIVFYPKGHLGVETESLPILVSCRWVNGGYSGGVSLGSETQVAAKTELLDTVDEAARRANLEPLEVEGKESLAFRTTEKVEFRFENAEGTGPAKVETAAQAQRKLRGDDVEVRNAPLISSFRSNQDGLTDEMSVNGYPTSEVEIQHRLGGTDVDVVDKPLLQEKARSVGRTLGRAFEDRTSTLAAVASRPDVLKVVQAADNSFYVTLRDRPDTWIHYAPEGQPEVNIGKGVDFRMGFTRVRDEDARWNAYYISDHQARLELAKNAGYLVAEDSAEARPGVAFQVMGRGPPPPPGRKVLTAFAQDPSPDDFGSAFRSGGEGGGGVFGPDEVARKAMEEPNRLFLFIGENRRASLERTDQLLKNGEYEEAHKEIEPLRNLYPKDQDILTRDAIASAGSGSADRGVLAGSLHLGPAEIPVFAMRLDEAAVHATTAQMKEFNALYVETVARSKGVAVKRIARGKVQSVEVYLQSAHFDVPTGENIGEPRYTFAMQDAIPAVKPVGAVPPASERVRIHDASVAQLQPEFIFDPATGRHYESATDNLYARSEPNHFQNLWRSYSTCSSLNREERGRREDCRDSLVLENGQQPENRAAL